MDVLDAGRDVLEEDLRAGATEDAVGIGGAEAIDLGFAPIEQHRVVDAI